MAKVDKLMTILKNDEVSKKVEPTKLCNEDGTYRIKGKMRVHTVGGAWCLARVTPASPITKTFSTLWKSLTMRASTLSPASCLTSGTASMM